MKSSNKLPHSKGVPRLIKSLRIKSSLPQPGKFVTLQ